VISVIVPTFNRHVMCRLALDSLVGQAEDVILVNAGTDALPHGMIPTGLTVRVIHKGHRLNQSQAINAGLAIARGDRVSIVQDDDTVLPGGLAKMSAVLDTHPEADAVYSLPQYTNVRGTYIETPTRLHGYLNAHPTIRWDDVQRDGLFIHGTATMYRRALLAKIGGWDPDLGTAEEYDAHLRMLHGGATFVAVPAVTVTYRRHPGGKSQDRFRRRQMRQGVMAKIYARLGMAPVAETPADP